MSKIIGIDLGTTYSAIAQLDDLGTPEVLASTDNNKKITASSVYIKDQNMIVGDKALDALETAPKQVVTETKRQMENDVVYSVDEGKWVDKNTIKKYPISNLTKKIINYSLEGVASLRKFL